MNVDVLGRTLVRPAAQSKLAIADCDIHPRVRGYKDVYPWLARRWQEHLEVFGASHRQPMEKGPAFPKAQPMASRRDAFPPGGGGPGSDLDFMRAQHLDPNNVELGILNPLTPSGQGFQNVELGAAFCHAVNEWQVAVWTSREPRLKASVVVPYEDAVASVREIEHWAGNPDFAQVLLLSRASEPLGQRRFWPIYEAAVAANLPVAVHAFGYGGYPVTSGGWPSYYVEEGVGHAQCQQADLTSLVLEGVFERNPKLRMIMVEAGFAWAPSLAWRLDAHWRKLRAEVPHLKRPPSEYIRGQVWFTTQPMEEPEPRERLLDTIEWMGWDRLLFATDYPHWDFDDPATSLPLRLTDAQRRQLFAGNAHAVYGI